MDIGVTLDEPLTSSSCAGLVVELIKYILYQKQQIPFTCDSLMQLGKTKVKLNGRNMTSINALLNSLKSTAEELSSQFHIENCEIKEIAILIGATIVSPKLDVRLELPGEILNSHEHYEYRHASKKPLLNLMRSMFECSQFQDALNLPLNPTNTFVLIKKRDNRSMSEFFLPKPQYTPSTMSANCFRIKLRHDDKITKNCNCIDIVRVYNELSESPTGREKNVNSLRASDSRIARVSYGWYQSKEVIKGFKFLR